MTDAPPTVALVYNGECVTHPNLYVRNLPINMDQTAVEVLFRRFGTCTGCKFFKTAAVPFAFIRLSTPAEALAAIKAMNGTTVAGKVILVKPADTDATYDTPNENLYVRNIPVIWNEEDIRQYFEEHGHVVSVRVLPAISTSMGQVAMVRFQSLEQAQAARDSVNATVPVGERLPLNVKFADHHDEKARKQQNRMNKSTGSVGPALHRFAPYPGASGPVDSSQLHRSTGVSPGGMGPHSGMPGELMPFDAHPLGAGMMRPPPWAVPDPAAGFGVSPPPPPPRPRPQQPQQMVQQSAQQPPVLSITMDTATGQFMMPNPSGPGSGLLPSQPQPPWQVQAIGSGAAVPLQQQAQHPGQVQSQHQALAPPQQQLPPQQAPRPVLQGPPQPQQQTAQQPPLPATQFPPHIAQQQQQAYGGQPIGHPQPQAPSLPGSYPAGAPPPSSATVTGATASSTTANPTTVPAAANLGTTVQNPYAGYTTQSTQQYPQQPYSTVPYSYPGYPQDPYAQAQVQHQQSYDAQAAAYYAAYYGQPPPAYGQPPPVYVQQPPVYGQQPPVYGQQPPAYGQPPLAYGQQPSQAAAVPTGQPQLGAGQAPEQPGATTPTDPYHAYYYYQHYYNSLGQQQSAYPQAGQVSGGVGTASAQAVPPVSSAAAQQAPQQQPQQPQQAQAQPQQPQQAQPQQAQPQQAQPQQAQPQQAQPQQAQPQQAQPQQAQPQQAQPQQAQPQQPQPQQVQPQQPQPQQVQPQQVQPQQVQPQQVQPQPQPQQVQQYPQQQYPQYAQQQQVQKLGGATGGMTMASTVPNMQQHALTAPPWQYQAVPPQPPQQAGVMGAVAQPSAAQQLTQQSTAPVAVQPAASANGALAAAPGTAVATSSQAVGANGSSTATTAAGATHKPNFRITVSNLPADTEKYHMYEFFAPYGAILAVHVTGGFGVVQYAERESAARAAAAVNATLVRGARVKVAVAEGM